MIKQSIAKIYLSEQRGVNQSTSCRCHHLFNAETYYSEHKTALGDLYRFDDVLLAGGKDRVGVSNLSAYVLLIPLYGAVECRVGSSEPGLVAAGQIQVFSIRENESYRLHNPFSDIVVNYLELFLTKKMDTTDPIPAPADADLNKFMNVLVQVAAATSGSGDHWRLSIGKFSGRSETVYHRKHPGNALFVFVIDGVFEVDGRLLHARDGLALWDTDEAEIEALSNDALLLVVENAFNYAQP